MKILHVVGARPNFMKTAPIMAEMSKYPQIFQQILVHTGQHYDVNMSDVFFTDLGMPTPDEFLNVGSGTHAEQTARVMLAVEPVLQKHRPDWVFVVGDVNSTLACTLVCAKLDIPVAHVEAGLRSGDHTMPEEINRIVTDRLANLLLTPSRDGNENLASEGIAAEKIHFVGNVMIDTLIKLLPIAQQRSILADLQLTAGQYILVTLHRPFNVDEPITLLEILKALTELAADYPIIFPVHPRTQKRIAQLEWQSAHPNLHFIEPQGYLDFLALTASAHIVLTDSGGIQEETTYLGIPCLTVRPNTERPVTIQEGTNQLVDSCCHAILTAIRQIEQRSPQSNKKNPQFWDGQAAQRIVQVMLYRNSS